MRSRQIAIAALLILASAANAEPAKSPSAQAEQPRSQPAKVVVLAAAETGKATAADAAQSTPSPPRHRVARVTTCRCGDPAPGEVADTNPEQ